MITYTLTEAEFLEGQFVFFRTFPRMRALRWFCIATALWVGAQLVMAVNNKEWAAAGIELFWLAALLLALSFPRLSLPGKAHRIYRNTRWLREEQQVNWSDEGVDLRSAARNSRLKWSDVLRWAESRSLIVIFQPANKMLLLPKRAFSEAQLHELREQLRARVRRFGKRAAQSPSASSFASS